MTDEPYEPPPGYDAQLLADLDAVHDALDSVADECVPSCVISMMSAYREGHSIEESCRFGVSEWSNP